MDIFENEFILKCEEFLLSKGFIHKGGKYYMDDTRITVTSARVDIQTKYGSRAIYGGANQQLLLDFIERYWEG